MLHKLANMNEHTKKKHDSQDLVAHNYSPCTLEQKTGMPQACQRTQENPPRKVKKKKFFPERKQNKKT